MSSKRIEAAREQRREALRSMLEEYMTLDEAAASLDPPVNRSRIYELVVTEGRIPALRWSDGGQNSPKWLVKRRDFERLAATPRYTGRPRIGDRRGVANG